VRKTLFALPAALAVVALAVTLAGCSAPATDPDGFDEDGCATSGPASESVKVSGDFGEEFTVEFEEDLTVENTERSVAIEGDGKGAAVEIGSLVTTNLALYEVAHSTEIIPFTESPEPLPITDEVLLGIVDTLSCATVGQRIIGVLPAERAYGEAGNPDAGIGPDATLLVVFDVVDIVPGQAEGEEQELPDGFPGVVFAENGQPTVTIPDAAPPAELKVATVITGDGAEVQAGDSVTVQYQGVNWTTGEVFDESWGSAPATFSTDGVIQGFGDAMVGQTVGSRVVVIIPPALGYGPQGGNASAGIGAEDTLVFVIDILATEGS
jgi:peptidylprolyl isomerase